jgi:hypothetical protein
MAQTSETFRSDHKEDPMSNQPTTRATRTWKQTVALTLITAGLGTAACGSSGESSATARDASSVRRSTGEPSATADNASTTKNGVYCAYSLALETAPEPDVDFAAASPQEIGAALQAWASETMLPLARKAESLAPLEIGDAVIVMRTALERVADSGDPSEFDEPAFVAAADEVHEHDVELCEWSTVTATSSDYAFTGMPATLSSGPLSIELVNDGPEVHELTVLRVDPDVTAPLAELMMSEEAGAQALEFVTSTGPLEVGDSDYVMVNLEPGRYAVACFIPQGATSMEALAQLASDAAPHAALGMIHELIVSE